MEEAPLFLLVVGEAVGELVGIGVVDDDQRPLLALHPVHRGQGYPTGLPARSECPAQPGFESGGVGVQGGQLGQGGEVVALGGAIHSPAMEIEGGDAGGQPHLVAQGAEHGGGGAAVGREVREAFDVGGEGFDALRVALGVYPRGQSAQTGHGALLCNPGGDARVQGTRRPA